MKQKQIDTFFKVLDHEMGWACEVILVGASAASLMGHIRPSLDIDFEIRLKRAASPRHKKQLVIAIDLAAKSTGVAVNYSENINGWSMVNYLDYRRTAVPYKKIGKLNVKLIAPEYWTIGKMARFLQLDIQDMTKIIRKKKLPARRLILLWARAVRSSDLSLELGQFSDHVEQFLSDYARKLWGRDTDPKKLISEFYSKT